MASAPWSQAEEERLAEIVGNLPWPDVRMAYNKWAATAGYPLRSEHSIEKRQEALGLERIPFGDWLNVGAISRITGISETRIHRWITVWPDILKPYRPSKVRKSRHYLRRDRIRRFARLHPEAFWGVSADDIFLLIEDRDLADDIAARQFPKPSGFMDNPAAIQRRPVRRLDTGATFPTVRAAAHAVGCASASICKSIRQGFLCRGTHWAYLDQQQEAA